MQWPTADWIALAQLTYKRPRFCGIQQLLAYLLNGALDAWEDLYHPAQDRCQLVLLPTKRHIFQVIQDGKH